MNECKPLPDTAHRSMPGHSTLSRACQIFPLTQEMRVCNKFNDVACIGVARVLSLIHSRNEGLKRG